MTERAISIAVLGSVNLDIVANVPRFPVPGETLSGATVTRHAGGKGANQALAAHRLGARVSLIACLGQDPAAEEALAGLREAGVNLEHCRFLKGESTGLALVLVSADGENQIVTAPGANAAFHADLLRLPATDAIITQLGVPTDTILRAVRGNDAFFTLNAAPARPVSREILDEADLLVVNEHEARAIGPSLDGFTGLLATTFGHRGATLTRKGRQLARFQPPAVEAVDSTGAGDVFTAALTVSLVEGMAPPKALKRACLAAAISVTRPGAQSGPTLDELQRFGGT